MALRDQLNPRPKRSLTEKSGQTPILARIGNDVNDPERTLAVRCGKGFDTGFSPYRSTRLSD